MFHFKGPTTGIISGPTGCGKTTFMKNVILKNLIQPPPEKVFWVYKVRQPALEKELSHKVKFILGMPDCLDTLVKNSGHTLLVLDDFLPIIGTRDDILDLYIVGSHHYNTTVFSLVQNLFFRGRNAVTLRRNRHYHILFNNPADSSEVMAISKQMFPKCPAFMYDAYIDSTDRPHGYLLLDVHPTTENALRLKTDIFDEYPTVYVQEKSLNKA